MAGTRIAARWPAGQRLRHARGLRGLTQFGLVDVVAALGATIARTTIARIETGQVDPDLDTVWILSQALGVDFAWLAGARAGEPELRETA